MPSHYGGPANYQGHHFIPSTTVDASICLVGSVRVHFVVHAPSRTMHRCLRQLLPCLPCALLYCTPTEPCITCMCGATSWEGFAVFRQCRPHCAVQCRQVDHCKSFPLPLGVRRLGAWLLSALLSSSSPTSIPIQPSPGPPRQPFRACATVSNPAMPHFRLRCTT